MTKKARAITVGRYVMHDTPFTVVLTTECLGGDVDYGWGSIKEDRTFIVMHIGMNESFGNVMKTVVHEVMEMSIRMAKGAYAPSFNILARDDSDRFHFFMSHFQFTEACDHAGDVLTYLIPDLKRCWRILKKGGAK